MKAEVAAQINVPTLIARLRFPGGRQGRVGPTAIIECDQGVEHQARDVAACESVGLTRVRGIEGGRGGAQRDAQGPAVVRTRGRTGRDDQKQATGRK